MFIGLELTAPSDVALLVLSDCGQAIFVGYISAYCFLLRKSYHGPDHPKDKK